VICLDISEEFLKNMATMKIGTKDAPLNCRIKHKGKDT
jgi:hypothetical protein